MRGHSRRAYLDAEWCPEGPQQSSADSNIWCTQEEGEERSGREAQGAEIQGLRTAIEWF